MVRDVQVLDDLWKCWLIDKNMSVSSERPLPDGEVCALTRIPAPKEDPLVEVEYMDVRK